MILPVKLRKNIDDSYDIHITTDLFRQIGAELRTNPIGDQYAIITDSNVKQLYGNTLLSELEANQLSANLLHFPAGEESKTISLYQQLLQKLVHSRLTRKSVIIALGGGVVGDISGFLAATYMRGIPYIQIPTTLLAQVDSSIGGKTALNLPEGKNLLGAFYQPKRVYIDPSLLHTLSTRHFHNGLVEIIKHGIIFDSTLFRYIETHIPEIQAQDIDTLSQLIFHSCKIKANIIQQDEREQNIRVILNYGHTLAHALEQIEKYTLFHGEAVAIGMNYAGILAVIKGFWRQSDHERQQRLLEAFNLPSHSTQNSEQLISLMRRDKKGEKGKIMFVLPMSIGKMMSINGNYKIPVPEEELKATLLTY
jgi:3-dehydroquinate synthase